jgi:cell division septum initiation protein DivIVA
MYGTRDQAVPAHPSFEIVLRGFDRQQVADYVGALKARLATIGAERDAALQRAAELDEQFEHLRRDAAEATRQVDCLRREAEEATTEVDRLQRSPMAVVSVRIQRMLQMAEDEAAELQISAEQESTSLRENARAEADRLLHETSEQCERLETESASRRQAAEAESAARYRQAESDSERRRRAAEQQSEHDIASRQAQTEAWIRDYQTRSVAALHVIMRLAHERLQNRKIEMQHQATALRELRADMTDRVYAVHRLLVEAVGVVDQPTAAGQADATQAVESSESSNGSSPQAPARNAGGAAELRAPRQRERSGPQRRPRQADQPTERFGLHP